MQRPGGQHWCCVSSLDGSSLGTLIPGVDHLAGGPYDAGGDPAVAFDSQGHVYYAGLGFDHTVPPNTVAVNKRTFDGSGHLTWSQPTFINPTTAPSTLNDKEWIAADANPSSPFRDRVYVTWTRFIFNPVNGRYVESPIAFAFWKDGGKTFIKFSDGGLSWSKPGAVSQLVNIIPGANTSFRNNSFPAADVDATTGEYLCCLVFHHER
jgi:hypothetical protein